ncbi:ELM1/GtrOC1 family putative glycosyltransferase [Caulobacter vibrioides]|uniref:ELM1/GtrOC1 family putative glycosyltransferase n=1 Tax=Caulobacter vibrioides TaxID=155892 RepID=UPI002351DE04|nr:ELM1/GtrOC1 family putative glycosyltransferase [Caulobacter vibrioides]
MMTFSRRTPETARAPDDRPPAPPARRGLERRGPQPLFRLPGGPPTTSSSPEDSTNMATEAASTGKPVFVLKMDGSSLKFRLFHEELERQGAARPYGGAFHGWTYEPVNETDRAAREVLARIGVEVAEPVAEPEPAPVEQAKAKAKPKPKARPGAEAKAPTEPAAPKVRKPRAAKPKA